MSTNPQWYMAVGGHQVGPVSEDEIVSNINNGSADANTLVFIAGMDNWTPLKDVQRFRVAPGRERAPPRRPPLPCPAAAPTRSTSRSWARTCSSSRWSSTPGRASWPRPGA